MNLRSLNFFNISRLLIGVLLLTSGFQKLIIPYQNFLLIIQTYEFLPSNLERIAAISVPWVELFLGVFLVVGLWLGVCLKGALVLFTFFVLLITQALLRGLPIGDCGCFGEAFMISPQYMVILDTCLVILLFFMIKFKNKTSRLSLDNMF